MARAELKLNKKQQRYYRYVIDRLMENTLVDVRDQKIWHPYDSHYSRHLIGGAPAIFTYFVKNKFGILPEEVELVWAHYKHRIKDENGWVQIAPMNESLEYSEKEINKQKKQDKFIEYVVRDLINDTYINRITFNDRPISGGEKIDAPFFRINKIGAQSFLGIVGMNWEARELFNDYIKNKYGAATDGEMNKIFMFYTEEIKELVKDINPESFTYTDNLDESISKNPKQQQLFDYVVNQMVDGTRIVPPGDGTLLLIIPDFINAENASPFLYGRYLKTGVFPIPNYIMLRYFKDTYGLLDDEVQLVWDRYREIMYRKLRKEYPNSFLDDPPVQRIYFPTVLMNLREHNKGAEEFKRIDNPKQHKLYNRIADKVVELTEVRDEQWGRGIFLTDLLDPDYPGQGMSLPPAINMSDYETFQKRMLSIVHDFYPMLEKYWFIEGIFDQIFILTRFVFPKLWNNFYKGEDQPEESTEYGEHALDYEEKMGKEKITGGSNTSWDDVANNESIDNKLFNINESKEDNYVDKIVDQLIDETYIVKEKRTPRRGKSKWLYFVRNPFMDVTPNFTVFLYVLIQTDPGEQFQKHCREIYGATPDQIKDIWSSYTYYLSEIKPEFDTDSDTIRKAIEPINESTSKKQKFLDTVLRDMLNQSTIYRSQFDVDTVITPSGNEVFNFHLWVKILTPPNYLTNYMRDTYGLIDEEIYHVWLRYKDIMLDRIKKRDGENNPFRITESTKPLPDSIFQMIQDDLFERTVKLPRTNKPLCTGGRKCGL